MATIAERIQEGMNLRGLKQVDIIELTGMNKGALSSYLSGKYKPKQDNIYLLAKALDVSEAWLMGYDVPIERKEYFSLQVGKKEKDLLERFNLLNEAGKNKTLEYVIDLAENERYQKENEYYVPEVLAASRPNKEMTDDDRTDLQNVLKFVEQHKQKESSGKKQD